MKFNPHPKQEEFYNDTSDRVLYGIPNHINKLGERIMEGQIRKVVHDKGFGFIRGNDNQDYFFHRDEYTGRWDDLVIMYNQNSGIKVSFIPNKGPKGLRANQVTRL